MALWGLSLSSEALHQETVLDTPSTDEKKSYLWMPRCLLAPLLVLLLLVAIVGLTALYKLLLEKLKPDLVTGTPEMRFKYGSICAENDALIPYWIFYVL